MDQDVKVKFDATKNHARKKYKSVQRMKFASRRERELSTMTESKKLMQSLSKKKKDKPSMLIKKLGENYQRLQQNTTR